MNEVVSLLPPQWEKNLTKELHQDYMLTLMAFLEKEEAAGKIIHPPKPLLLNALVLTELDDVDVVILGQDPYHGANQAHGLSFSVERGVKVPPSLKNIYKELHTDLGCDIPSHGNLSSWAEQGVLLLNSVLSVEQGLAASHEKKGWERFTDRLIEIINIHREGVVFLLWGAYAQKKGQHIDTTKHLVLTSAHPSPLSAYRGFLGCQHFSKTNNYLCQQGRAPIDWQIT